MQVTYNIAGCGMQFGLHRHRPPGNWVQTTPLLAVQGVTHHSAEAKAFAAAVRMSEKSGWPYGVALRPEPENAFDPNAIKVLGLARNKPLFRPARDGEWHLGYVPKDVAAAVGEDIIKPGHAYCAELYDVTVDPEFLQVRFFILLPADSPAKDRIARRVADTARGASPSLTPEQRSFLKDRSLGLYRNTRLAQAESLRKLGEYNGALDMYLRVAWLDRNGVSNAGLYDGKPFGPWFDPDDVFNAPGIIKPIAQAANTLGLTCDDLELRLATCGARERDALAPLTTPVDDSHVWAGIVEDLIAVLATGTKWRTKK